MDLSMPTIEELTGQRLRKLAVRQEDKDDDDEDFYAEECILYLEDNDELSVAESGFMLGYLENSEE